MEIRTIDRERGAPPEGYQWARGGKLRKASDLTRYTVTEAGYSTPCWLWSGKVDRGGYAVFHPNGAFRLAHRASYEKLIGPIPDGLHLDHLCRNRSCVNPAHLEPVTKRENTMRGMSPTAKNARKTHCKRGHQLSGDNLVQRPEGGRTCVTCRRMKQRENWPHSKALRSLRQSSDASA